MKKISMVISAYNEEQGLREFYRVTDGILRQATAVPAGAEPAYSYEFYFVNDGSSDRTGEVLSELRGKDPEHVKLITFSRNFGHEAAMCAGLDYADGDLLIFMDADLQHPPQVIPEILKAYEGGAQVINMVRLKNETAGIFKNLTSRLFYAIINWISTVHMEPSASDFFALDRKAAEVLRHSYREKIRFLRGFVQNIGFRKQLLPYEAAPRIAGQSHYSFRKLLRLSINTIVCFSDLPLKAGIYAGIVTALLGVVLLIVTLLSGQSASGGTMVILTVLCFLFAVLFLLLGAIGEYIAVLYTELKDRPIYIIDNIEREN